MAGLAPNPAILYPTSLYDIKDPRTAWAAIPQAAGYPCDPLAFGAYGDRFDPVDSEARRRNATRETTSTLKAWLNEHRKNPYPTKGEKIMLAIITKMTLTQVSTWFANARRRLKKENKMTWEPRNKTADDLDDVSIDEDEEKRDEKDDDDDKKSDEDEEPRKDTNNEAFPVLSIKTETIDTEPVSCPSLDSKPTSPGSPARPDSASSKKNSSSPQTGVRQEKEMPDIRATKETSETASVKPKIWSLAKTATSQSPPPTRRHNFGMVHDPSDERLRINRFLFKGADARILPNDLCGASPFQTTRDIMDFRSRIIQDSSSADSSLSSPPLWRRSDSQVVSGTPVTPSEAVSMTSSSSCSPSLASPQTVDTKQRLANISPLSGYNSPVARYLSNNGHFSSLPEASVMGMDPHSTIVFGKGLPSEKYVHHTHLGQTLDLRTLHSQFLRPSTGCPIGFSSSPLDSTSLHQAKMLQNREGKESS